MITEHMPELRIGNLRIPKPIVQGGMGAGISLANLASAVANEGGIGVISSIGLGLLYPQPGVGQIESDQIALRKEIRKARSMTSGVLGVNIMVAISDFDNLVKTSLEEKIDILFLGAGLPLKVPATLTLDYLRQVDTKVVPIVSSARAAKVIFQAWDNKFNHIPDGVVVEGPLAGGHLGFRKDQLDNDDYMLEKIVPQVIDILEPFARKYEKEIPVIAAGGIYDGSDIDKFLNLGASGVQMGTRFVATNECDASKKFKDQYLKCSKEDIGIFDSPVGLPGRGIINGFLQEAIEGNKKPLKCSMKCLKTCDYKTAPYCIAHALINAQRGDLEKGFAFSGANAYKVDKIVSVHELIQTLEEEYCKSVESGEYDTTVWAV